MGLAMLKRPARAASVLATSAYVQFTYFCGFPDVEEEQRQMLVFTKTIDLGRWAGFPRPINKLITLKNAEASISLRVINDCLEGCVMATAPSCSITEAQRALIVMIVVIVQ